MANKTINTQILLRNDTLANWQASVRVLGKGEPAIVFDPNAEAEGYSVRVKYGDGVHTFSELPYSGIDLSDIPLASATANGLLSKEDFDKLSKLAAIAYKDKVDEADLTDALREKVNAASEGNHAHLNKEMLDTITAEKIAAWDAAQANVIESVKVNGTAVDITDKSVDISVPTGALSAKDKVAEADLDEALATKVNATYDDTALTGRVDAVEALVGDKSVATQIATSINALDLPNTYEAKGAAAQALSDAKTYADGKDDAIAAAKKAGDDAQADVDALEAKFGTIPTDKTIVDMINEAKSSASYDDTAIKADIAANTAAISTLNGTGEGSVKKSVDDAINAFATNVTDDNVVNTFKELVDYCATHGSEAAELAGDIAANTTAIEALETLVGSKAVATQISEAIIAALQVDGVDKYALATELADAVAAAAANETAITAIKTKLDTIAEGATKVEASATNGNVKINGTEVTVFEMPEEAIL